MRSLRNETPVACEDDEDKDLLAKLKRRTALSLDCEAFKALPRDGEIASLDIDAIENDAKAAHAGMLPEEEEEETVVPPINPQGQLFPPAGGIWCSMLSQEGLYPGEEHINQDSSSVNLAVNGSPTEHIFGVFDGHGAQGTGAATFVSDRLAPMLIRLKSKNNTTVEALHKGCQVMNTMLRNEPEIDDSLSGTTVVVVWMNGVEVHVSNLGDSRAVLGTENMAGEVIAMDLSHDQTPFRSDERIRVEAAGAEIKTGMEKHKEVGPVQSGEYTADDPPRCYFKGCMFPGTAFTRSIGDSIAERIGVYAVPEILVHTISPADRFIILASDGVWEFISSQEAVDIVRECQNPWEAAYKLVSTAWEMWLEFDVRTDDITVTVIFIDAKGIGDPLNTQCWSAAHDAAAGVNAHMISRQIGSL